MTTETTGKEIAKKPPTLREMLEDIKVKNRFEEILGKRAPAFISSIISASTGNATLAKSEPHSIVSAAAMAASLDLPINGALGSAALVPYKQKDGTYLAQFQIMRTGGVQLAQRSGQYASLHAGLVYDGQLIDRDDITGEVIFDAKKKKSEKVIGYVAFFRLLNGFQKYLYMSVEECQAHGKRYSKSYASEFGMWKTNPEAMSLKTVLKRLISKWGPVAIDSPIMRAIAADQAVITPEGKAEYIDGTTVEQDQEDKPAYKPITEKAPAAAKSAPPPPAKETKDGEALFKVYGVADCEVEDAAAWVIRTTDEPAGTVKYHTDDKAAAGLAGVAQAQGQRVAVLWCDKKTKKGLLRWITNIRIFDGE